MIEIKNDKGSVRISNNVFTNLVGEAATSCFGVKGMALRSVSDGLVHLLKKESMGKGVYLKYNDDSSISIDLHIIIDRDVNINALANSIISEVTYKIEKSTGINVESVNVFVDSIVID